MILKVAVVANGTSQPLRYGMVCLAFNGIVSALLQLCRLTCEIMLFPQVVMPCQHLTQMHIQHTRQVAEYMLELMSVLAQQQQQQPTTSLSYKMPNSIDLGELSLSPQRWRWGPEIQSNKFLQKGILIQFILFHSPTSQHHLHLSHFFMRNVHIYQTSQQSPSHTSKLIIYSTIFE